MLKTEEWDKEYGAPDQIDLKKDENLKSPRFSTLSRAQTSMHLQSLTPGHAHHAHTKIRDYMKGKRNLKGDYGTKSAWYYHALSLLFWGLLSGAGVAWSSTQYSSTDWDGIAYACILFSLATFFIVVDWVDDDSYGWKMFQVHFESWMGFSGMFLYGTLFFFISLACWMVMALEDDEIWTGKSADYVIYITYYVGLFFLFLTMLSGWELFSYYAATVSWVQGFMWISVIGGMILTNARLLREPPTDDHTLTWHRRHDPSKLIQGVMLVLNLSWWMFVVIGCVGIALFAEVSNWAADQGILVGIALYLVFAFAITLNPIAPGTVIDACGGFLFIIVFEKDTDLDFFASWAVGLVIIIIIHYISACMQWWLGTLPSVQSWLNTFMPIDVLSTSDAVLGDAGWFKVGLVGYVFLDTLNGLNQGRINMDFWTQLLSEWSSIPAAMSFSILGASIAVQGKAGYDWTIVAVPLFLLSSSLVTLLGSLFGLRELGNSTDMKACWHSREKWASVHFFHFHGLASTQEGWARDIFEIWSAGETIEGDSSDCLLAKVYPLQIEYVAAREKCDTERDKLMALDEFANKLEACRGDHYSLVQKKVPLYVEQGWMSRTAAEEITQSFWDDAQDRPCKQKIQFAIVGSLIMAFWGGIVGFFMDFDLATSVQDGWGSVSQINSIYWIALGYFLVVYNAYHADYWWDQIKSMGSTCSYLMQCCPSAHSELETKYQTSEWQVPKDLEARTIQGVAQKLDQQDFFMVDPIEHDENKGMKLDSSHKVEVNVSPHSVQMS